MSKTTVAPRTTTSVTSTGSGVVELTHRPRSFRRLPLIVAGALCVGGSLIALQASNSEERSPAPTPSVSVSAPVHLSPMGGPADDKGSAPAGASRLSPLGGPADDAGHGAGDGTTVDSEVVAPPAPRGGPIRYS